MNVYLFGSRLDLRRFNECQDYSIFYNHIIVYCVDELLDYQSTSSALGWKFEPRWVQRLMKTWGAVAWLFLADPPSV